MSNLNETYSLLPEVDEAKTLQRVKYFFTKELPRAQRIAQRSVGGLKSTEISDMPAGEHNPKALENSIIKRIGAEQVVQRTAEAMDACSNTSQTVLIESYVKHEMDEKICQTIGYSLSQFYRTVKPAALFEFADMYMLDDLHITVPELPTFVVTWIKQQDASIYDADSSYLLTLGNEHNQDLVPLHDAVRMWLNQNVVLNSDKYTKAFNYFHWKAVND